MYEIRLAMLRKGISDAGLDAMLIMSDSNRFYMSGFHGSNGLLYISSDDALLFTDFRYTEQASKQAPAFEIILAGQQGLFASCVEHLGDELGEKLGVEKVHLTLFQYEKMQEQLDGESELVPVEKMVENVRRVKAPAEIDLIKKAQSISETAYYDLLGTLTPEMTEAEAALELEFIMRRNGSGPMGFDVIVGAGPNAALPHHYPDDTKLGVGRSIVIDFGATYGWYNSDTTRTVFLGSAPDDMKQIYNIVREAQQLACDALDKGKTGFEIDELTRKYISERGHGEHFGHGLGHGVGVDVHEAPTLSPKSEDTLVPYNIFSVEPGIYIPNLGGVRIEDVCWIKPDGGYENITTLPKDLVIL